MQTVLCYAPPLLCCVLLQVWALQQGPNVYVVGRSNRSKVLFEQELDSAIDAVPEVQQPAVADQPAAAATVSAAAAAKQ